MPRDHSRIFTSIWGDDDFRDLPAAAQRLYALLLTQKELTYAGALEMRIQRWSGCAPDTSCEDIRAALAELTAERFVVVDESTEEVLVRSYLRRNEIWKQPKLLTLALRQAAEIQSKRLRSALRSELLRLPDDRRADPAREFARTLPDTPWHTPTDTPPDTPPDTPARTPGDTPPEPFPEPLPEPLAIPPRARAGARVTSNQEPVTEAVDGDLPGGVTQANPRATPTPNLDPDGLPAIPPDRCPRHRGKPDDGRPCAACGDARRTAADAQAARDRAIKTREVEARRQAAADRAAAITNCRLCDDDGRLNGTTVCDHNPDRYAGHQRGAAQARAALAAATRQETSCAAPTS